MIIATILSGVVLFLCVYQRTKKTEKLLKTDKLLVTQYKVLGQRGKNIYDTLSDKEKLIVDYLIQQPVYSLQSKIHRDLEIPKSSLFRTIQKLEAKTVIETIKTLKARRIKLSEWFLE